MHAPVEHRSAADPLLYPFRVVPDDVFVKPVPEFREAAEFLFVSVEHLLLHHREQVLRLGVVEAVALPRHRLDHPVVPQRPPVAFHLVGPALVGVEHHPGDPREPREEPREHRHHHRHVGALRQAVGEYLAVAEVHHRREVALPGRQGELRHVGPALPEEGVSVEVPAHQVRRRPPDGSAVGAVPLPVAGELGGDPHPEHRPQYPLVVDPLPRRAQGQGYKNRSGSPFLWRAL
jgi:hypothetical protein